MLTKVGSCCFFALPFPFLPFFTFFGHTSVRPVITTHHSASGQDPSWQASSHGGKQCPTINSLYTCKVPHNSIFLQNNQPNENRNENEQHNPNNNDKKATALHLGCSISLINFRTLWTKREKNDPSTTTSPKQQCMNMHDLAINLQKQPDTKTQYEIINEKWFKKL